MKRGSYMLNKLEFDRWALVVLLIGLVALTGGCSQEAEQAEEVVRPVKLMTVGSDDSGGEREYPGRVEAAEEVLMGFEVPGRIVELPVLEGQAVKAGALLARLDDRDYKAQLDSQIAQRNEARADFERNQALYERDAISLRDLEVVRRRYEVTEANLRQAEKAVSDTRLVAPFDGRVAGRLVENQENVQAKQSVVQFLDDSTLEIKASVPETDFLKLRGIGSVSQMTELLSPVVEISAAPGTLIPAYIKEMRNTADPMTRTYEVTLGFTSPEGMAVALGMTAKIIAKMPTSADGRIVVPVSALTGDAEGNSLVFVFDESAGVVNARQVTVGEMTGGGIVILSGLEAGDRIAALGAKNLHEGMRIIPQNR
jgi:RND family efflux transporter MFP subunit